MADVSGLRAAVAERARQGMESAVNEFLDAARRDAPVRDRGTIPPSLTATPVQQTAPTRFSATVSSPLVQSATTDRGARPHIIRANRAKVLRFEVGGEVLFRKQVNHPGNRGTGWFSGEAAARWRRALEGEFT